MWTDNYCYINQCQSGGKPIGADLYNPAYNKEFEESFLSMIYPRGIIAAGSFYRYDDTIKDKSEELMTYVRAQNYRMRRRGIITCPDDCKCLELSKCGVPYIKK